MVEAFVRLILPLVSSTRYASVLGLGFGDCGKGHFVDALTRRWQAHTVVRFSGGAQAGHNVVTPAEHGSPERHHTFSQFGAGTLAAGTRTVLLDPMIIHPTALLVEAGALSRINVNDALSRLTIDAQCIVTTPYHQAAGRLRELLRGNFAHGTCGVGVGETVRHALSHPGLVMRYADLSQKTTIQAHGQLDKLHSIRETLLAELLPQCSNSRNKALTLEIKTLQDEALAAKWFNAAAALARQCPPASTEMIGLQLKQTGCVLFEGAQGILLDEWRGFHPHTTWSSITTDAVEAATARFDLSAPIEHYGVLRTYLTRHGTGPLPTHDESLDEFLPEPHNSSHGWQGRFRRGNPDAVLLRYALDVIGPLTGLLISHLEVFQQGLSLKWSEHYMRHSSPESSPLINRIPVGAHQDLSHQESLTQLLTKVQPQYALEPISSDRDYLDRLASVTALPIVFRSYGKTHADVR